MKKRKSVAFLPSLMELQFKKSITAMIVLAAVSNKDRSVNELVEYIKQQSEGLFQVEYLYDVLYRLECRDCLTKTQCLLSNGYKCSLFHLTETGKEELRSLKANYAFIHTGVNRMLENLEQELPHTF